MLAPESAKKQEGLFPVLEEPTVIIPIASQSALDYLSSLGNDTKCSFTMLWCEYVTSDHS